MQEQFVTYKQALALKELGFDEPCFGYYDHQIKELDTISSEVCERLCKHDTYIKAPTYSQAFRWFREKHGLNHMIDMNFRTNNYITQLWKGRECLLNDYSIETYEDAESACIDKLIEIVKKK